MPQAKLADLPSTGNGGIGIQIWSPPQQGPNTTLWINSNDNWAITTGYFPALQSFATLTIWPVGQPSASRSCMLFQHMINGSVGSECTVPGSSSPAVVHVSATVDPLEDVIVVSVSSANPEAARFVASLEVVSDSDTGRHAYSGGCSSGIATLSRAAVPQGLPSARPISMAAAMVVRARPGEPRATDSCVTVGHATQPVVSLAFVLGANSAKGGNDATITVSVKSGTAGLDSAAQQAARSVVTVQSSVVWSRTLQWWRRFWSVSSVTTPTVPVFETLWYAGQYFMGASMREGRTAPGLYGPWVSSDKPAWEGDYTLDYNQEAAFYGVFSSNRLACAQAYFPSIEAYLPSAEAAAPRCKRSCGGIQYPAHIAPWGYPGTMGNAPEGSWNIHWDSDFATQLFLDAYDYTKNVTFLDTHTFPLLTKAFDWWLCWLQRDPVTGKLYDFNDATHEGSNVTNSILALSWIKAHIRWYVDVMTELNRTVEAKYRPLYVDLAPFPTANVLQSGRSARVWTSFFNATPAESDHFAVYPVWPTQYVDLLSPLEDLSISRATLDYYANYPKDRPVLVFPAAVRVGVDPKVILTGLAGWEKNFRTIQLLPSAPGGGIENVGVTQALNDMLVQGFRRANMIHLFPVWPPATPASFSGIRVKGGFVVSAGISSSGEVFDVHIAASGGQGHLRLRNPWNSTSVAVICNGVKVKVHFEESFIAWNISHGDTCSVSVAMMDALC